MKFNYKWKVLYLIGIFLIFFVKGKKMQFHWELAGWDREQHIIDAENAGLQNGKFSDTVLLITANL